MQLLSLGKQPSPVPNLEVDYMLNSGQAIRFFFCPIFDNENRMQADAELVWKIMVEHLPLIVNETYSHRAHPRLVNSYFDSQCSETFQEGARFFRGRKGKVINTDC